MRGLLSAGGYVPLHRLDRSEISGLFGKGGAHGARAVASFDEDTTTMGYAAARNALRSAGRDLSAAELAHTADAAMPAATADGAGSAIMPVSDLWFATTEPAYLDKTNACAIHAALGLGPGVGALDFGGALRSGIGALRAALSGRDTTLVVAADLRDGLPTSAEEAAVGDGAATILVGDDSAGELIAEWLGSGTASGELLDRWRPAGSRHPRSSPERFGEAAYAPLLEAAWSAALASSGIEAGDVDHLLVSGMNARAVQRNLPIFGAAASRGDGLAADIAARVGNTGAAHPLLLLVAALEQAQPGETIAVAMAADGAEVLILRTTEAISSFEAAAPLSAQIDAGTALSYGAFLSWRDMVAVEPPNRPPPSPPSAAAGHRRRRWKFGFVGSRDRSSGMVHLPPARVSERGGATDDMDPTPMAYARGTIASFTVDRLAYSPSPPVVFAVVDFDGGGRAPLELTDVAADEVAVGRRVEPTFRRLFTADGVHNYFWKVRPVRDPQPAESARPPGGHS